MKTDPAPAVDYTQASLNALAWAVRKDWKNLSPYAAPYVQAMQGLGEITDDYGMDSGKSVVLYFLSNAGSWRGPVAKAVKAELKRRCAACRS